jgi:tetratricopeptide (TPR) repeat protein
MKAVAHLISQLNIAQVPRSSRHSLAKICRRAGLFGQGLRLLHPIIRNEKEREGAATAIEICEYAAILSRNGSIQEALDLLTEVNPTEAPEALLYLGFGCISNWDYAKAVEHLEKFLKTPADSYTKLIARVNLGASYLSLEDLDQAERILSESIELAQKVGASRLIGNCWQLMGEVHLQRGHFEKSREVLNRALEIFGQSGTYDQLLIYKWQTILSALESKSTDQLRVFRAEAIERSHWESVREADLFTTQIQFDQKTFDHLFYGTPMEGYRKRIDRLIGAPPSQSFFLGQQSALFLDLETGELQGASAGGINAFSPGKKNHQVLSALTRDFYLPRNMGTLFAELYPDEYFDINSSPLRIRQLLTRARKWIDENEIPASIQHFSGTYRLVLHPGFSIRIPLQRSQVDSNHVKWQQLKLHFSNHHGFTAAQACQVLQISRSNFHRLARWAVERGELQISGQGKAIMHQIVQRFQAAA